MDKNKGVVHTTPMPLIADTDIDFLAIRELVQEYKPDMVYIEQVHALFKASAKSTFNFGAAYGGVIGAIATLGLPYVLVQPKEWQRGYFKGLSKDMKAKDKSELVCLRRHPHAEYYLTPRSKRPHDGVIDAILIAEYGVGEYYVGSKGVTE